MTPGQTPQSATDNRFAEPPLSGVITEAVVAYFEDCFEGQISVSEIRRRIRAYGEDAFADDVFGPMLNAAETALGLWDLVP